jgi:hypothetical protein
VGRGRSCSLRKSARPCAGEGWTGIGCDVRRVRMPRP